MSDRSKQMLKLWWMTAPDDVRRKRLHAMAVGRSKANMRRRIEKQLKTCSACGESKPRAEFRRRDANADGYQGTCKVCTTLRERQRGNREVVEPTPLTLDVWAALALQSTPPKPKRPGWIYTIKALLGLAA